VSHFINTDPTFLPDFPRANVSIVFDHFELPTRQAVQQELFEGVADRNVYFVTVPATFFDYAKLALGANRIALTAQSLSEGISLNESPGNIVSTDDKDPVSVGVMYAQVLLQTFGVRRIGCLHSGEASTLTTTVVRQMVNEGMDVLHQQFVQTDLTDPDITYLNWHEALIAVKARELRVIFLSTFFEPGDTVICRALADLEMLGPEYMYIMDVVSARTSLAGLPCHDQLPNLVSLAYVTPFGAGFSQIQTRLIPDMIARLATVRLSSGAQCSPDMINLAPVQSWSLNTFVFTFDILLNYMYGHILFSREGRLATATAKEWMDLLTSPSSRLNSTLSSRPIFDPYQPLPPEARQTVSVSANFKRALGMIRVPILGFLHHDFASRRIISQLNMSLITWDTADGQPPKDFFCVASCLNNGTCVAHQTCACLPGYQGAQCESFFCPDGCANGVCTAALTCTCTVDWFGQRCDVFVTEITAPFIQAWSSPTVRVMLVFHGLGVFLLAMFTLITVLWRNYPLVLINKSAANITLLVGAWITAGLLVIATGPITVWREKLLLTLVVATPGVLFVPMWVKHIQTWYIIHVARLNQPSFKEAYVPACITIGIVLQCALCGFLLAAPATLNLVSNTFLTQRYFVMSYTFAPWAGTLFRLIPHTWAWMVILCTLGLAISNAIVFPGLSNDGLPMTMVVILLFLFTPPFHLVAYNVWQLDPNIRYGMMMGYVWLVIFMILFAFILLRVINGMRESHAWLHRPSTTDTTSIQWGKRSLIQSGTGQPQRSNGSRPARSKPSSKLDTDVDDIGPSVVTRPFDVDGATDVYMGLSTLSQRSNSSRMGQTEPDPLKPYTVTRRRPFRFAPEYGQLYVYPQQERLCLDFPKSGTYYTFPYECHLYIMEPAYDVQKLSLILGREGEHVLISFKTPNDKQRFSRLWGTPTEQTLMLTVL